MYLRELQRRVARWMDLCFGEGPSYSTQHGKDPMTRTGRFFEEAAEFAQACGMSQREAIEQVVYTFNRPIGKPEQEIGGVLVTLAAAANAQGLHMDSAAEKELARIHEPNMIERIRAKQATKPKFGTLPGAFEETDTSNLTSPYRVGDYHG